MTVSKTLMEIRVPRTLIATVALVCFVVLTMPLAAALTLLPLADGDTDVSNTSCDALLSYPIDQDIDIPGPSDTVRIRMGAQYYDHRTSGSAAIRHHFWFDAWYLTSYYTDEYAAVTTGGMTGPSLPFAILEDASVSTGNTMDVVYYVDVRYYPSGTLICSVDNSTDPTTFTFV